jgi:hypothetical protein
MNWIPMPTMWSPGGMREAHDVLWAATIRDIKGLRRLKACFWHEERQEWLLFNDDWTPENLSGTPKFGKEAPKDVEPPKPAVQQSLF